MGDFTGYEFGPQLNFACMLLVLAEKTFLSAKPYVHGCGREIKEDYEFIIFASEGLWEHYSDNEATQIVHGYHCKVCATKL